MTPVIETETWTPPPLEPAENRFWKKAKENPFVPLGNVIIARDQSVCVIKYKCRINGNE